MMTATRDPVTRRRRMPALVLRRAWRRRSDRQRRATERATEAVKEVARPVARLQHISVLRRTAAKAWDDRILGLSAEAAFWQLLSLAPLFLALLGSIGYLSGFLGESTVSQIEASLLDASRRAFAPSVVDQIISPTVDGVLRRGRADVVSVGFLLGLWAGSSATATFVNTVTIAYGMRDLRGAVRSRLLALGLYLLTVLIGIVLLPVMVIGPGRLVNFFPASARGDVESLIQSAYWPIVAVLLLVGLVTFYHVAPPRRLPWRRGFPGAVLAALVFVGGTYGLREYISFIADRGLSYGALAAPIGALLFFYILALAVLLGAELNATIEQTWPTRIPDDEPAASPPDTGRGGATAANLVAEPAADLAERGPAADLVAEHGPAADLAEHGPAADLVAEHGPAADLAERGPAADPVAEHGPAADLVAEPRAAADLAERGPAADLVATRRPAADLVAEHRRAADPAAEDGSAADPVAVRRPAADLVAERGSAERNGAVPRIRTSKPDSSRPITTDPVEKTD